MTANADEQIRETLDAIYASESRRILATLIRLLGDFDLAEDALHDAFRAALRTLVQRGRAGQSTRVAHFDGPFQGN